jgi:NADPH:quinone reductase-like Zn-dependent oxidoreductase
VLPTTGLQLRSLIKRSGELEIALVPVDVRAPEPDEILVRIEAAPINPSDLGLLLGAADVSTLRRAGTSDEPIVTANVPSSRLPALAGRLDDALPVGNEGAGIVVAAGASAAAQALLGRAVAVVGGATYAQFRIAKAAECLPLPDGATPADGASCFVNPLTALGMVETMRHEGHTALVHTAAASNLGQMLNRMCLSDGVPLVNIVRGEQQAAVLRELGAPFVCNSSAPTFVEDLIGALVATGATLAFDAVGGGRLASQILNAMEAAISRTATTYSRYGSTVHKQVYIYGGLDTGPTELQRGFGMSWGIGGWLLFTFLAKIGPVDAQRLRSRVAAELKTTFASRYSKEISLVEALDPAIIVEYNKRATGEKYLINPNKGLA